MAGSQTLRGVSAGSLSTLSERLDGSLDPASAAKVGDDLFSVADLLRRETGLRRTATDSSLDAEARSGLLRRLLEGKVDAEVLDLVGRAVGMRWSLMRDLPDALEHLGVVATVRSAPDDAGRLADELFGAQQLVSGDPGLRDALSDPARSRDDKIGLVVEIFGSSTLPATTTLVKQALSGSFRTVGSALQDYQRVAADVHAERVATVRVARGLGDDEMRRLEQALARQYGRQVHLNVLIEPELVGGVRIEIGDDVIDGTVAALLDEARRRLAG